MIEFRTGVLYHGDCLDVLKGLPGGSVHCCVTSPPYYGLRSYLPDGHPDKEKEIGLEETPEAYVARMVEVFREVRRVLRDDGTCWVNIGDSYNNCDKWGGGGNGNSGKHTTADDGSVPSLAVRTRKQQITGLKPKDLIGIPWRVAFALQADGWWLRQDIIWHKPNPMPESVTDRCTKAHEYIFLLTKSARYWYDAEAVKEPNAINPNWNYGSESYRKDIESDNSAGVGAQYIKGTKGWSGFAAAGPNGNGRNKRSVWTIPTQPFKEAHFATFPPKLIEPCVLAGCPDKCCPACGAGWVRVVEKDDVVEHPITTGWQPTCTCNRAGPVPGTVLDPFFGAGTSGLVAINHYRRWIGIELNDDGIAEARLKKAEAVHKQQELF